MRILVVEDELRVRAFVVRGLREEGFVVTEAEHGPNALQVLVDAEFDLILMDWMLPGTSGVDVVRQLRARGDVTPIILVTAKDTLEDKVAALDSGADDYVVKPFAFEELLARIRAVLRRTAGRPSAKLTYDELVLDPQARKVERAGTLIRLTAREFALLQFLMEHREQVVSRTRIVEAVWEHDFETFSNIVEVYIRYLRKKVDDPFGRRLIHTVRGVGYVLRAEPTP